MKGETEIEGLARMVANGFSAMSKEFSDMSQENGERFDMLEERIERIEKNQEQTNNLIQRIIIPNLDQHSRRIKDLELKIA